MATPIADAPSLRDRRATSFGVFEKLIVEIHTQSGAIGFAIALGGRATVALIEQVAPALMNESPEDIPRLWIRLHRLLSFQCGAGGPAMLALSGIELALWDLLGQLRNEPVARLLGAPSEKPRAVYCTGPDMTRVRAQGFPMGKITLRAGHDARELLSAIDYLASHKEAVGRDFPVALDCWGGLNLELAAEFARLVGPLNLAWIEEPYLGYSSQAHAKLKSLLPNTRLASGEHLQVRSEFESLLASGVDIVQPDPRWCGGMTGMRQVADMAEACAVALMPHSGGVYSLHFAVATPYCGMLEYSNPSADGATVPPYHGRDFIGEPPILAGTWMPNQNPGFGLAYAPGFKPFDE